MTNTHTQTSHVPRVLADTKSGTRIVSFNFVSEDNEAWSKSKKYLLLPHHGQFVANKKNL